jgi:IclR family transcriptional regulator, KDG regulon repressor
MGEIHSLARGLQILEELTKFPKGLGITELAEEFQVDKGSISRTMQTLAKYGFAEKDSKTRKYKLGPKIVRLSRSVIENMPLRETAKPFLEELVDKTGECSHLAILANGETLYLDQVESPSTLRVSTEVGTMNPLHCTALGKVLLAFTKTPIPENLKSYTYRTISDPSNLQLHLNKVKVQGYAIDDEEFELGVRCIAVPIFDYRDRCIGTIGISGPTSRLPLETISSVVKSVQVVGEALSARMSFNTSN